VQTLSFGIQAVTNRDGQRIKKRTTVRTISTNVDKATGFRTYEVIDEATEETEVFLKETLDFIENGARRSTNAVQAGPSTTAP
jgi:hypothetical protein